MIVEVDGNVLICIITVNEFVNFFTSEVDHHLQINYEPNNYLRDDLFTLLRVCTCEVPRDCVTVAVSLYVCTVLLFVHGTCLHEYLYMATSSVSI